MLQVDPRLARDLEDRPERFVYATVVGEHLYGIAEADTVPDVRACHVLPVRDVVGMRMPPESFGAAVHRDGLDFEFLSHDLRQLCLQLVKKNGQVIEHVLSPLVVVTSPAHEELSTIARACVNRHMAHHYLSHARLQWERASPPTVRGALLAFRVLWTAVHLLRTGGVETSIGRLAEIHGVSWAADLVARRRAGEGATALDATLVPEFARWSEAVARARDEGPLPAAPPDAARRALDGFLVRQRMETA